MQAALLAQVSISPILTVPDGLLSECKQAHIVLWTFTFLVNLLSVFAAVVLLGYLLQCPKRGCKRWLADLGFWVDFPIYSTLIGLILCIGSAVYTGWISCTPSGPVSGSEIVICVSAGATMVIGMLFMFVCECVNQVRWDVPASLG